MQYLFTYKTYITIAFYFLLTYLFISKNNFKSKNSDIDLCQKDEVYIDIKPKTQECLTESNEIHWGQFEDIEKFI